MPLAHHQGPHDARLIQDVRHAQFGEGVVVSSAARDEDEEVTVAFPDQGVKKLMASFAALEKR